MLFFDEGRYKNGSEPEVHIMIILRSTHSYLIGINRDLEQDFTSLIIQYVILDKGNLWAGYWGRWRDLIAMHHFSWTDGLFSGYKVNIV